MPGSTPFARNIELGGLWIQRWVTGLITNRSPLFTPITALGLQVISRLDALIDGLNVEISPTMTVVRRPSYPRYSSVAFGAGDFPLNYYSFQNTSGTIFPLVDTPNKVYNFSTSTNAAVFTKGTTARGDFFRVGDNIYYCNSVDTKFANTTPTTWNNWGIVAPAGTPSVGLGAGPGITANSGYNYVYAYVNTVTGHVSAASAPTGNTGPFSNQRPTISGINASTDPQVTNIWIFRTVDGGGIYYFLAQIANTSSNYTDISTSDAVLNQQIIAPLSPNNAPAPAGSSLVTFWDGRLWTAAKQIVYWAMGPQTITGSGEQAFNLTTNFFRLPINVTGFAPTSQGLLVFTTDTTWIITGSGGVYFINPWQRNFGIKTPNAVSQDGDLVFVFTSRSQLFQLGVQAGLVEVGQSIRPQLAAMNPKTVSIAVHRNGPDEGLFVSDGAGNIFRYSLTYQCWSPKCQPVQGAGVLGSIETTDSTWTLLLGGTVGAQFIWGRSTTSWTDDGGTYTGYATVGSIILGPPGSEKHVKAVCLNLTRTGTYPQLYVMLNEVNTSGGLGFSLLPNPTPEPPTFWGTSTGAESQTLYTRRHYLKSGHITTGPPIPQLVQHMQIKVSFFAENFGSELLGVAII